jgi:hypothetical protein
MIVVSLMLPPIQPGDLQTLLPINAHSCHSCQCCQQSANVASSPPMLPAVSTVVTRKHTYAAEMLQNDTEHKPVLCPCHCQTPGPTQNEQEQNRTGRATRLQAQRCAARRPPRKAFQPPHPASRQAVHGPQHSFLTSPWPPPCVHWLPLHACGPSTACCCCCCGGGGGNSCLTANKQQLLAAAGAGKRRQAHKQLRAGLRAHSACM